MSNVGGRSRIEQYAVRTARDGCVEPALGNHYVANTTVSISRPASPALGCREATIAPVPCGATSAAADAADARVKSLGNKRPRILRES